jgi:hypothetical protein
MEDKLYRVPEVTLLFHEIDNVSKLLLVKKIIKPLSDNLTDDDKEKLNKLVSLMTDYLTQNLELVDKISIDLIIDKRL